MRDLCVLVSVAGPVLVVVAGDEAETTEVAALEKVEKDPDTDAAVDSNTEVVGTVESKTDAPESVERESDVVKVEDKMDEGQLSRLVTGVTVDAGGGATSATVRWPRIFVRLQHSSWMTHSLG